MSAENNEFLLLVGMVAGWSITFFESNISSFKDAESTCPPLAEVSAAADGDFSTLALRALPPAGDI